MENNFVTHSSGKSHPWDDFVGEEARNRIKKNKEEALKKLKAKMQSKQSKPRRKPDLVPHEWDKTIELEKQAKLEERETRRLKLK